MCSKELLFLRMESEGCGEAKRGIEKRRVFEKEEITRQQKLTERSGDMYFRSCPYCGASLDPGEACECKCEAESETRSCEGATEERAVRDV